MSVSMKPDKFTPDPQSIQPKAIRYSPPWNALPIGPLNYRRMFGYFGILGNHLPGRYMYVGLKTADAHAPVLSSDSTVRGIITSNCVRRFDKEKNKGNE
jgi:hypothetical protein